MLTLENLLLVQSDFRLSADFTIPTGARVALLGASGAGKSTLLAAIAGFLPPDSGHVLWQGSDLTSRPPGERGISMLFQDNNLFPHLTARQNVALGLRPSGRLSVVEQTNVTQALQDVGLSGLEDRRPADLSGGQQSRVAIARLLVQNNPLILLDEPFSALGPARRAEMLDLVHRLCDQTGATALLVSHDIVDAQRFGDVTVWIEDGTARPPMPTTELLANPPAGLRAYLGT